MVTTPVKNDMVLAAVVTEKASGKRYYGYRFQSESRQDIFHYVYIRAGRVEGCSCESRQYRPGRFCKHMRAMFNFLKTAPESFPGKTLADVAPLASSSSKRQGSGEQKARARAQQRISTISAKGTLGSNVGFSLMR